MRNAAICYVKPDSAKPDGPISESKGSRIFRNSDNSSEMTTIDLDDWRTSLIRYLENPDHIADRKVQRQALKYVTLDNTLYRRTIDGLLLKYLGSYQSRIEMEEVHEGIYGSHQSTHKMKWLFHRVRFYWSNMLNDCFRYYKGYKSCQKFRDVQLAPTAMFHLIIKPWSFHGWTLDFVSQIHPALSKGYRFMLVTTDYFIKWTEAVPLKNMMQRGNPHYFRAYCL
jgi:hypothetical protein